MVRRVANILGNKNCTLDEISFEAGRQTLPEIFRELDSSDIFVLFISNDSLNSKWVEKEITHAERNLTEEFIDRILSVIIDPTVTYRDTRIPEWIAKPYNLKYTRNEALITKKIKQALREVCLKNNKFNREREKISSGATPKWNASRTTPTIWTVGHPHISLPITFSRG